MKLARAVVAACICVSTALAHGSHSSSTKPTEDWALYHLEEEHHISNFDAPSFFALHDFNNDGVWTTDEIRRTYGLDDESLKDTPETTKAKVVKDVFDLFDQSGRGEITRQAFLQLSREGKKLPDSGLGPGHHGDDEYEYEIHHFEKYHGPDTTEEDLIHPEDIEHFRKHDLMEDEEERIAIQQSQSIVESNIPLKFRKQQQ